MAAERIPLRIDMTRLFPPELAAHTVFRSLPKHFRETPGRRVGTGCGQICPNQRMSVSGRETLRQTLSAVHLQMWRQCGDRGGYPQRDQRQYILPIVQISASTRPKRSDHESRPNITLIEETVVPEVGLEPTHLAAGDFESPASTIPPLGPRFVGLPSPRETDKRLKIRVRAPRTCHTIRSSRT